MSKLPSLPKEGLMITRRRKKWKFAHFNAYPNCFTLDSSATLRTELKKFFNNSNPIVLELAAGTARFSLEMARRHPKTNFIAIDIKSDRLYTSAKDTLEEGVANLAFVRMPISRIGEAFARDSIDTIWLTFPDPYPRKRAAKHRLTHSLFLQQYRKILKSSGSLYFKTDNRDLFLWSLEQLVAGKWQISELSFDLHESGLPDDYKIQTTYEARYIGQNFPINFVTLKP